MRRCLGRIAPWTWFGASAAILLAGAVAAAQDVKVIETAPSTPAATPASPPASAPTPGAEAKPPDKPGEAAKPGEKPGDKPGEKPGEKSADKPPEKPPTLRPNKPEQPANPDELKIRPDEKGLISLSFKGQPWPAVLQWLAEISQMSLDWQEAPPDYLDLTTRRRYTVDEVRDLINSALLARGYSLLRNGEMLIVVNLKKLDTSLVPRITPAELDQRGNYELVKVYFDLNRLRADVVAEEFKPLLSPNGKISALTTTNRLDLLDTAGNLRRIRDLLSEEQSASGKNYQIRPFRLQYTRAAEVVEILNSLLGIKPKGGPSAPMTPEQMQAMQQAQQQAMQMAQQHGRAGGGAPGGPKSEPEILLAVNSRENMILANAPADKLAIIEQAIKLIDVPQERPQSALASLPRVKVYRLSGVDPDPIVKVLKELGTLDPTTKIEVDHANKSIIANAPLADHVTIGALVEKLDGSGRRFEVIQLRRLDAEYVAGSIEFLIRGAEDDKNQRRRYYYYDYFDSSRGSTAQQKDGDKFQVEADIENNRLLLRANNVELEEVRELLVKLGEISEHDRAEDTLRVIPAAPGDETERLLERIKRLWPSVAPNPLEVEPAEPAEDSPEDGKPATRRTSSPPATGAEPAKTASQPAKSAALPPGKRHLILASAAEPFDAAAPAVDDASPSAPKTAAAAADSSPRDKSSDAAAGNVAAAPTRIGQSPATERPTGSPAVAITRTPHGLVITSQDPLALERMMELAANVRPAVSERHVFPLQHAYAKDVAELLESVFADEGSKSKSNDTFARWYYYDEVPAKKDTSRGRLSKRRPLKFVPDPVTNTILVQGADAAQLAEVQRLIDLYDRVEPPDSQSVRRTQMIALHYSTAPVIAEVVKDVYRDLLSPNDKALQSNQPQQQQREPRSPWSYFAFGGESEPEKQNTPRFKGLLSVGVDTKANMVVVSAPQFLLSDVAELIHQLDESARPQRPVVKVMRVGNGLESQVRDALANFAEPGSRRVSSQPPAPNASEKTQNGKPGGKPNQPVNPPPAAGATSTTE